jgi:deoxyribonuclease V
VYTPQILIYFYEGDMGKARIHHWNVSPGEAIAIQERLRHLVKTRWDKRRRVKTVAGVDMSTRSNTARAAVVITTFPDLNPLEQKTAELPLTFPYIPGLLSFRECPALLAAFERIEIEPDLILVDGQGIAHQRRFGIACHLGVLLDRPTIGCAKSRLLGTYEEPASGKGSYTLLHDQEETIGVVLRTRDVTRPVYVSIGHRIDLETAIELTLACTPTFRLPEPLRMAHRAAGGAQVVDRA